MNNIIKQSTLNKQISSKEAKNYALHRATILPLKLVITSMIVIAILLISYPSFAEQTTNTTIVKSYHNSQDKIISGDKSSGIQITTSSTLTRTRDEIIEYKAKQAIEEVREQEIEQANNLSVDSLTSKKQLRRAANAYLYKENFYKENFYIYDGYAQLIKDIDEDGYFQTFSVIFDADLIFTNSHNEAVVYAELYLSENGGPWLHYFSTDSFVIQGENPDDAFEVVSTLEQGFISNQYDVLIDLYQEGNPNIMATYSSDDTNSLYALPLESSDYDPEYIEYVDYVDVYQSEGYSSETHVHAGSNTLLGVLTMILILLFRQLKPTVKTKNVNLQSSEKTKIQLR